MLAPTLSDLTSAGTNVPEKRGRGRPSREERGVWAERYTECINCQKTDRPHKAHGYCLRCYMRYAKRKARRLEKKRARAAGRA